VVTENERVLRAADALDGGFGAFGDSCGKSHHSLRDDFEVAAPNWI